MANEARHTVGHTPGPWGWYGSTHGDGRYYLATTYGGRRTVMSFRRSGTQSAQPEFQVDKRMVPAAELVRFDVDPTVKGKTAGKASPSVYRFDFSEIDHPDARLIATSPDFAAGVEVMITHEESGGDGWWRGWEMLKAAYRKAGLDHDAPWFKRETEELATKATAPTP